MPIQSILIANRGEIAVRIIRAARELGLRTVQVHSEADADSPAVAMADEAVEIGPPHAAKSYLNAAAILAAAAATKVDAIHPGYGFFAENPEFADSVVAAGLIFIGPSGDTMRVMGDKVAARAAAQAAGVPTVPGSHGRIADMAAARAAAEATGFPVMIKAAAGGGGRGIRIATNFEELERLAPQAGAEAKAAFGDDSLYLEKVITGARHIEVQIVGDGRRVIHCFERECSLQRRRQKLWEEAPAPALPDHIREKMCRSAVGLAEAVQYRGVGTVEYLYDDAAQAFYFIEMNTRIQVEHPVTEMITGIDLVRAMIRIAGGEPLGIDQRDVAIRGHAIEVRINAEDPAQDFMPFPGLIGAVTLPAGPGVRFDGILSAGYAIPPFYDSLLGKLIVHDESRDLAIERLRRALDELHIGGIKTTKPLYQALVREQDVRSARVDTGWLERWLEANASQLNERESG